ncbi:hypothetical protein KCP76_21335 [Salmonella enterica subsp. enterica serovar Weltevreden]|nr:hypothetical protein KCP76_21335 [Salmonella enterica subsp. enterica serovar Weltevreden]
MATMSAGGRWPAPCIISLSTLAERVNSNPAGRFIYLARFHPSKPNG